MKLIVILFILSLLMIQTSFGVSIVLDGSKTVLSGSDCSTATYRFGTTTSYNGDNLDIILEVTDADNDYIGGACVDTQNGVVSFHIRDGDSNNNVAFMDLKFTVVRHGTLSPINVDTLTITNFDLDRSNYLSRTLTDDVYYKNPLQTLISNDSNVLNISGDFYDEYTVKLRGKNDGNCNDSATLTELSCRAGAIWKNSSTIYARVQNDNAYGSYNWSNDAHRLLQFSFEYDDIAPLISENNTSKECGTYSYSTNSNSWVEGIIHSSYDNSLNIQKTISIPNASQLKISFSGETEEDYDYLYIIDKNGVEHAYSGNLNNQNDLIIDGSSVTLKFTSDGMLVREGVTINVESLGCHEDYDFGDAPNQYTHVSHKISSDLYLGNFAPDSEDDQQSSSHAIGDGDDDNDGVTTLPTLTVGDSSYTVPAKVYNNTGQIAYITAWIDFNRNGIFEYAEALNTNNLQIPSSNSVQTVDVQWSNDFENQLANISAGKAIMRIRLTTSRILRCDDPHYKENGNYQDNYFVSPDGEVEDYEITIEPPLPDVVEPCGTLYYSTVTDAWVEGTSPVEYHNNLDISKTIEMNGTDSLRITVNGEIEHGNGHDYDWIYIYDENGNEVYKDDGNLDNTPFIVQGNRVTIALHSDGGATEIGATVKIEGTNCSESIDNPTVTLDGNSSVLEGDSNTTDLIFSISLSKPAVEDIVLNYEITDINTTANEDYILDSNLSVLIPKDANSSSIVVKVKGDTDVEEDESFSLKLIDTTNAIVNSSSVVGTIINDDEVPIGEHFTCSEESYLTTSNNFYSLNLSNGSNSPLKMNYTTDSINAIGYNVKDNFIWGWDLTEKKVVRIDANYTTELFETSVDVSEHEISDSSKNGFTSGDVSKDGILYLAKPSLDHKLHRFDLNSGVPVYLGSDTFSNQSIHFGDFAINPIDNYLYTTANKRLYRIDPSNANIEDLGLIEGDLTDADSGYFHSYVFDKDGNMYFYSNSNGKKVFKLDLSDFNAPSNHAEEFTTLDWVAGSGDGARCANAEMPEPQQVPFTCDNDTLYLSNRSEIGTGNNDSGATWLHSINRDVLPYAYVPIGEGYVSSDGGYNAIGYNVQDNFIYALYKHNLLRIDKNGVVKDLGEVQGLIGGQLYTGEFDRDGNYYVGIYGGGGSNLYKIDIDTVSVVDTIPLKNEDGSSVDDIKFWDMAIDETGDYFYMMIIEENNNDGNEEFAKLNISTGVITRIGEKHSDLLSGIGLTFSDKSGKVYMMEGENGFYKVDTQSGNLQELSSTLPLTFYNDGTSCPDANISEPPGLSISSNVMEKEGDSGTTDFTFTISVNRSHTNPMQNMSTMGFMFTIEDGTATLADEDYSAVAEVDGAFFQMGNMVPILPMTNEINITVKVKGDTKIEPNETFFVNIVSPRFIGIVNGRGMGTIINDDIDLDQDNDGILDSVEYGSCAEGIQTLMSFDNFGTGGRTSTPYTTYCYEDGDGSVECQQAKGIQYWEGSVHVNDGEYAIVQHPNPDASGFSTWSHQGDHTGNSGGRMMVVNASLQPDEFYRRTYSVIPNANMTVDLWILNVVKHGSNIILPNISFHLEDMNGNQIGSVVNTGDIPENGVWNHYTLSLNPQNNRQIQVVLVNNAPGGGGNDLALDDIRVQQTFCDHDNDGIADYLDLDSDNDGIADNIEAQTTQDYIVPNGVEDDRGVDTAYPSGLAPIDTDGDNIPDFIDTDSDNDGTLDIDESGLDNPSGSIGENGLYNTLELSDDYNNTQGVAYDKNESLFRLIDSDNDTLYDGSNASPMGVDFDYRDNNNSKPIFTISNISKKEGDSGPTLFDFKVSINRTTGHGISFDYQTADGESSNALENAIVGSDYNARNGHMDIEQNVTSTNIRVSIMGDIDLEDDENFLLKALNIDGADKDSFTAVGTIINDDDTDRDTNTSRGDLDEDNDGLFDDTEIGDGLNLIAGVDNNFTKVISTQEGKLYRFTFKLETNSSSAVKGKIKAFTDDNSSILINNIFYTMERYDALFKAKSNRTRVSFKTDASQNVNLAIVEVLDSDEDGVPDFLDLDSDNDGIPDNIEAQTTQDYIMPSGEEDDRGVDTAYVDYSNGLIPIDTDEDSISDYIDTDSDNDGFMDSNESGLELSGDVGENGLDNSLELNDGYTHTHGMAYDKNYHIFMLKDSDDDTRDDGSNATPPMKDFDYRDTNDNTPLVSIDEIVSKVEGDSGEKTFTFKISLTEIPIHLGIMSYSVRSSETNELSSPQHDSATAGEDFIAKEGNISILDNQFIYEITVRVKGDKKVEKDEEFIVDIIGINFVNRVTNGQAIGVILNDDLKIRVERDNSEFNQSKEQRTSFYTQISGRDFDYSIASYNEEENSSYPLQDITFKVGLYNNDTNVTEVVDYVYFNESRVLVSKDNDLNISKAIKDAGFKIYYLKDSNGTILHGDYATTQLYTQKFNENNNIEFPMENSSDHFAIRPASFLVSIKDVDANNNSVVLYRINNKSYANSLNLVAEYPYIIEANATLYGTNEIAHLYTTSDINSTLIFNSDGSCNDDSNSTLDYSFTNGSFTSSISKDNVGNYILDINDSEWTEIDQKNEESLGCILNSASNTPDSFGKFGCNIQSDNIHPNIEFSFQPFEFDMNNTILSNIHKNGKAYLYMSDLNLSQKMGVELNSTIIARGQNHGKLTNFTKSCIDNNPELTLNLKFEFEDDRGTWSDTNMTLPQSVNGQNLMPQQIVSLNDDNISALNMTMIKNIILRKQDFKDEDNGTMHVSIFYNMEKLFDNPTNPIKVNFISLDLNSTNLDTKLEGEDNFPHAKGDIDVEKIFYFARISSYLKSFPNTNKKSIPTPLFLEVYCRRKAPTQDWCRETMQLNSNGMISNGQKTYRGWYLATQHDSATEGKVLELKNISSVNSDKVTTNYTTSIPPFIHGKIENIQTLYIADTLEEEVEAEIEIVTDLWLRFNEENKNKNASYFVTFQPVSGMAGVLSDENKNIGLGYNLMRTKNEKLNGIDVKNGKMSW